MAPSLAEIVVSDEAASPSKELMNEDSRDAWFDHFT